MTREEAKQLLMIIDAAYPAFEIKERTETINAWAVLLGEHDFGDIQLALRTFINTSGSAFPPSVAQLIEAANMKNRLVKLAGTEAWTMVRRAIRRGIYYSKEEFEQFPEEVKKTVGSHEQLSEWARCPSEEIDTVIASNFRKNFEAVLKRQEDEERIPAEVKQMIAENKIKMIGAD